MLWRVHRGERPASDSDAIYASSAVPLLSRSLPVLLSIDWRRVQDLPPQGPAEQGLQDSDGAFMLDGEPLRTAAAAFPAVKISLM